MRTEPFAAARQLIFRDYPDCTLAVLGGSAGRGEHNEHSDLDIVVIDGEGSEDLSRKTVEAYGWVVELFFIASSEYREQFDAGVLAGNPTLQRIIAEGKVLRTSSIGNKIREEAKNDLDLGPLPLTSFDIDVNRYVITELMMDLRGSTKAVESWFIAQKMTVLLCEFMLRANRQWIGEGKSLFRFLSVYDASTADALEKSMALFYRYNNQEQLLELAERILEPYGGPHLIGYEE
ncbi:nucleotidyltransferase domain-containing protein [Paenibacillus sp. GCM10028914]|uniref:nucleotidyltransferase domain-containing protein n=1 Tax=Paenibacillus sp. GCM10028914 TaxID=3273416 RepID=UPI00360ABE84